MIRAAVSLLVLVACSKEPIGDKPDPQGSATGEPMDAPKQDFKIDEVDIPDEPGWHQAVMIAGNMWTASFNKHEVARVTASPVKAPTGETTKYLLKVVATKGSETVFTGTALISRGAMINSAGLTKLEAHFAALKFPKETKLHLGHLIMELYVTKSLDAAWLRHLPDTVGWDYDKPQGLNKYKPATLVYDDKGALLTLYREGASASGSGYTPPPLERLEVRIDPNGLVTKTASRKASGTEVWERFTP